MSDHKLGCLPVLITMGDPAGIGPEIILKAMAQQPTWLDRVVVAGDQACLDRARCVLIAAGLTDVPLLERVDTLHACVPGRLRYVQIGEPVVPPAWGEASALGGRVASRCIEWACSEVLAGRARGLVTAPLHKKGLALACSPYLGHTEYLQALAAEHLGVDVSALPVRMMLSSPELCVVLLSIHVSLRQALSAVTHANVLETLRITHAHFAMMGRPDVRIAVAGLNPHAGEEGLFGLEEVDFVAPAVRDAQVKGWHVQGPFPPDTVFMNARRGWFDVVVALYHDQGLIPIKLMGVEHGVNTTIGLPFLRTSPDHGTAYDLAGRGVASAASILAALQAHADADSSSVGIRVTPSLE